LAAGAMRGAFRTQLVFWVWNAVSCVTGFGEVRKTIQSLPQPALAEIAVSRSMPNCCVAGTAIGVQGTAGRGIGSKPALAITGRQWPAVSMQRSSGWLAGAKLMSHPVHWGTPAMESSRAVLASTESTRVSPAVQTWLGGSSTGTPTWAPASVARLKKALQATRLDTFMEVPPLAARDAPNRSG
jgi:hypothetical protein